MPIVKQLLFWLGLGSVYFLLSLPNYSGDIKNHLAWADSLLKLGPLDFYDRQFPGFAFPNYPPLAMASFAASLKFYQFNVWLLNYLNLKFSFFPSHLVIFWAWENVQIAYLKLPEILATLGIGAIIWRWTKQLKFALLFLLNPAIIYLSAVWGQIDLVPIFLLLAALYLLELKRPTWSVVLAGLSLLTKQTVLIFWLIYLVEVYRRQGLRVACQAIAVALLEFYLAYLPFHQFSLSWPFALYYKNFQLVAASTSENAFNLWALLYNFKGVSDTQLFWFTSLQNWGYLLFILVAAPLFLIYWQRHSSRQLFIFLALIALSYFLLLTRMHERYLVPAVVWLTLVVWQQRRYWPILVYISALHFINLYHGLSLPGIEPLNFLLRYLWFYQLLVVGFLISWLFALYYYWHEK